MTPERLRTIFAWLRLGLAGVLTALFADGHGYTSSYVLTFKAMALAGWWNVLVIISALGFGLIGAAILDQIFLEPMGWELIPG